MLDYNNNRSLSDFLSQLERVPWFKNIGKPIPLRANVNQIHSWEDWLGPEDSGDIELNWRQQSLYDDLFSTAGYKSTQLAELWKRIHTSVFRDAALKVPYDADRDTWYGPTAAVWDAAWTAGLVGLCLFLERDIPSELLERWKWFAEGHWPCGQTQEGKFIIY